MFNKIIQYLKEQKIRLIYIFSIFLFNLFSLFFFKFELLYFIIKKIKYNYFIFTNLFDLFIILCLIIIFFTFLFTLNYSLIQYYLFKKTAITHQQQQNLIKIIIFYYIFNLINILIITQIITPNIWNFFLSFELYNQTIIIELIPQIKFYIYFLITWFLLLYTILILFHIIYFLILQKQYLQPPHILYNRKFCYPTISILISLLTPPDIFSLLFFCIPCYIFNEFLIFHTIYKKQLRKIGFEPTM